MRYNERICIDGREVPDADLIASFERIEAARGSTTLTFFEYNALAALDLFMPAKSELVASSRSDAEVAKLIGADWLIYQDLEDLIGACVHDHSSIKEFDTSCFSGNYVTGDVTPEYLARLESERSDLAQATRREADRGGLKVISKS